MLLMVYSSFHFMPQDYQQQYIIKIQIISNLNMANHINVDVEIDMFGIKSRVLASGVALFFAFLINYCCQIYTTYIKKVGRDTAQKKLLQTSQVLHWFGIASIFSIYPPDFFGASSAGLGFITLAFLIFLHIFCYYDKSVCGRSLWSIFFILYHLSILFWIALAMGLGFAWTQQNYSIV